MRPPIPFLPGSDPSVFVGPNAFVFGRVPFFLFSPFFLDSWFFPLLFCVMFGAEVDAYFALPLPLPHLRTFFRDFPGPLPLVLSLFEVFLFQSERANVGPQPPPFVFSPLLLPGRVSFFPNPLFLFFTISYLHKQPS